VEPIARRLYSRISFHSQSNSEKLVSWSNLGVRVPPTLPSTAPVAILNVESSNTEVYVIAFSDFVANEAPTDKTPLGHNPPFFVTVGQNLVGRIGSEYRLVPVFKKNSPLGLFFLTAANEEIMRGILSGGCFDLHSSD